MANAIPSSVGIIQRRLSPYSFVVYDPQEAIQWLERLDWVRIPTVHRTEVGRLELLHVTACVFASGLVVLIDGRAGR